MALFVFSGFANRDVGFTYQDRAVEAPLDYKLRIVVTYVRLEKPGRTELPDGDHLVVILARADARQDGLL